MGIIISMIEKINEPISVDLVYSSAKKRSIPFVIEWKNRRMRVSEVGFYHRYNEGKNIIHIFEVIAEGMMYRLAMDAKYLNWTLEAISDGQAD